MTLVCRLWSSADNMSERKNFGWKWAAADANSQRWRHFLLSSKTKLSKSCFSLLFLFLSRYVDLTFGSQRLEFMTLLQDSWMTSCQFFFLFCEGGSEGCLRSDRCAELLIAHGFGLRLQCYLAFTCFTTKKTTSWSNANVKPWVKHRQLMKKSEAGFFEGEGGGRFSECWKYLH